jgi:NAD(P)-dependent dehydrogenase (short-subunit alcohol dehydrogenase family)
MPSIQVIRAGNAELPKGPPLVVAITGATSGIGSYTLKAYADTFAKSDSKLRVYIVGRNAANAEELLSYGRNTSPGSDWRFVQASNLALISDVDRVSKEIIRQEEESPFAGGLARLDVLYMGHALSPFQESKRMYLQAMLRSSLIQYDSN